MIEIQAISTSKHYFDFRIVKSDKTLLEHDGTEKSFQNAYTFANLITAACNGCIEPITKSAREHVSIVPLKSLRQYT